ncbi:hypothetical protein ABTU71_19040, partial [Acinetobacter baumannii]
TDALGVNGSYNAVDAGADNSIWLNSGSGNVVALHAGFGNDWVNGYNATDTLQFGANEFSDLAHLLAGISQAGADTHITTLQGDVLT